MEIFREKLYCFLKKKIYTLNLGFEVGIHITILCISRTLLCSYSCVIFLRLTLLSAKCKLTDSNSIREYYITQSLCFIGEDNRTKVPPPQPPKAQEDEDDLHSGHEAANRSNVKTNKDDENLEKEKEEITTNTTTTPNENSSHEHVAFLQTKTETEETKEE